MTINRQGPDSLYAQIAALLAREIAEGKHQPFARLGSEQELMTRFDVSRITVRQAISSLMRQGLVISRQGKGTFVAGPVLHHPLRSLTGFYDTLVSQGIQPETKLLEFGPAPSGTGAGVSPAAYKGLPVALKRLYRVKRHPFALMHAFLPRSVSQITRKQAAEHTVYSILQNLLGVKVERAELGIRARQAGDEIGGILNLEPEKPLLVMERVSYSMNAEVCERSVFYIQPEAYEFNLSVQGPLEIAPKITKVSDTGQDEQPVEFHVRKDKHARSSTS